MTLRLTKPGCDWLDEEEVSDGVSDEAAPSIVSKRKSATRRLGARVAPWICGTVTSTGTEDEDESWPVADETAEISDTAKQPLSAVLRIDLINVVALVRT